MSGATDIEGLSREAEALVRAFAPALQGEATAMRLIQLANVMQTKGWRADATRVCLAVLSMEADPWVTALAHAVLSQGVPPWHVRMLHDGERSAAYDRSLRASITPGMLVLDIGTGSGLLAILAARAGAGQVIACEQDPGLAVLAAENVRRNGCADRVTVIAKHSRSLVVGTDLPRRADLLVSEVLSNEVIHEGVLDTVQHAREQLLTPEAPAIPVGADIMIAATDVDARSWRVPPTVAGVDVSVFSILERRWMRAGKLDASALLTETSRLFSFDLSGRRISDRSATVSLTARRAGRVTGLAQWMHVDLGHGIVLPAGHETHSSAWATQIFPARDRFDVTPGQTVVAAGRHNRSFFHVWIE